MSSLVSATNYRARARAAMLDDKPLVPHAYDDEFENGTLDAKWVRAGAVVAFDDTKAIDPYAGFATEHRSSVHSYRPSWLMVQPASVGSFAYTEAVTLPSECFVWARLSFNMRIGTNADNDHELGLVLCADSGGAADFNNRVGTYLNESAAAVAHTWGHKVVGGAFTVANGLDLVPGSNANSVWAQPFCYVGIQKISTTYHLAVGNTAGHWMWFASQTHASTMAWLGIAGGNASTASPGNMIHGCDFIRYKAGRFLP